MGWKIRHQGSPKSKEFPGAIEVLEGLRDGHFEATDEVMGPNDRDWQPLEKHPTFEEAVADLEAPPPTLHPDESRLDMNPLIDVALVLLIFFILTTTYDAIRKVLELPKAPEDSDKPARVNPEDIKKRFIFVKARDEGGTPKITVDDVEVTRSGMEAKIAEIVKEKKKTEMLLDIKGVEWGVFIDALNAAKGAGISKIVKLKDQKGPAPPAGGKKAA
jgi:biopolymer transport protein ExbD